jgi:hypothetical protein
VICDHRVAGRDQIAPDVLCAQIDEQYRGTSALGAARSAAWGAVDGVVPLILAGLVPAVTVRAAQFTGSLGRKQPAATSAPSSAVSRAPGVGRPKTSGRPGNPQWGQSGSDSCGVRRRRRSHTRVCRQPERGGTRPTMVPIVAMPARDGDAARDCALSSPKWSHPAVRTRRRCADSPTLGSP